MNTWKKQEVKGNFRNHWLQKSDQRKCEKNWINKLEKVAKAVTQYIRSGN
jgi:hypothetical protein